MPEYSMPANDRRKILLETVPSSERTFGKLTVLSYLGRDKHSNAVYEVECACERKTRFAVTYVNLKYGNTTACKACRTDKSAQRLSEYQKTVVLESLVGQVFGELTVISEAPRSATNVRRWNCLCSCGKEHTTSGTSLKSGSTKSCGCKYRPSIIGQRFGMLEVIAYSPIRAYNHRHVVVKCDCGVIKTVAKGALIAGSHTSCGCQQAVRAKAIGVKYGKEIGERYKHKLQELVQKYRISKGYSPDTQLTPYRRAIRNTQDVVECRKRVFARDEYTCQLCGKRGVILHMHHLTTVAEDESVVSKVEECVTLCGWKRSPGTDRSESCHYRIHRGNFVAPPDPELTEILRNRISKEG